MYRSNRKWSKCAGCRNEVNIERSLIIALGKQWHLWCFNCFKCGKLLAGEYMAKNGLPYCEQDYKSEFGILCIRCGDYVTGNVLKAGNNHFHDSCAHCTKCGQIFYEGEDVYIQDTQIVHLKCREKVQIEESDNSRYLKGKKIPNISSDSFKHLVKREQEDLPVYKFRESPRGSMHSITSSNIYNNLKNNTRTPSFAFTTKHHLAYRRISIK